MISGFEKALLGIMIAIIMFGMGSTIDRVVLVDALRRPWAILVGVFSQFGFMPFLAWAIAGLLGLSAYDTVALILVGCLPAGTTSNMFTHFARGDVALSISMTTVSTGIAMIMTPLMVGFWTGGHAGELAAEGFYIPYKDFAITLAAVLIPVAGGMYLRKRSPGWARVAEETAGFVGFLVIIFIISSALPRNMDRLLSTTASQYGACILLGFAGMAFGWIGARVLGLNPRHRRTVALETGIQNTPIAFAVILLSFPAALQNELMWLPIIYSLFIVIESTVVTLFMRRFGAEDWASWKNGIVQQRLFGKSST